MLYCKDNQVIEQDISAPKLQLHETDQVISTHREGVY